MVEAPLEIQKIKDFKAFFNKARKKKTLTFAMYYSTMQKSCTNQSLLRTGLISSKKAVSKSAVKRNRVKRRLRGALQQAVKQLALPTGRETHVVLVAHKTCLVCPWDSLVESVTKTMQSFITEETIHNAQTNSQT